MYTLSTFAFKLLYLLCTDLATYGWPIEQPNCRGSQIYCATSRGQSHDQNQPRTGLCIIAFHFHRFNVYVENFLSHVPLYLYVCCCLVCVCQT